MLRALLLFAVIVATVRADVTGLTLKPTVKAASSAVKDPAPLLVVLHGNNETGAERAKPWRAAVARQGWKLLALDCPRELGCNADGQWYMWNGNEKWIFDQVRELAARERIDTSRIYLAGWSGGATFVGKHMNKWPGMFAAVVIHGGGQPPRTHACPEQRIPSYFLVGDANPAHGASRELREYLERCGQSVEWDLLPGANHRAEDAALTPQKAEAILKWLENQPRVTGWS